MIDILDILSLEGESVDDDEEMGYLSAILFESFWTLDGVGSFILMEAVLKVLDSGLTPSSNGVEVGAVFSFL